MKQNNVDTKCNKTFKGLLWLQYRICHIAV